MIPVLGWDKTDVVSTKNLHPETIESKVINLVNNEKNNPSNSKVYARLMLWKKFGKPFTNKELMPIKSI